MRSPSTPHTGRVWELDPANSRDLIDRLRPHARRFTLRTAQVGEGWRPLVEECHERLQAAFPDCEPQIEIAQLDR
jgi:hypothetical protein